MQCTDEKNSAAGVAIQCAGIAGVKASVTNDA